MSVCESSRAKLLCLRENAPKAQFSGPTYPTHFQWKISIAKLFRKAATIS